MPDPLDVYTTYTGGREYDWFVKQKSLERAISSIGDELHGQYLLSYSPNDQNEAGFHNIIVEVDHPGYEVRTARDIGWRASRNKTDRRRLPGCGLDSRAHRSFRSRHAGIGSIGVDLIAPKLSLIAFAGHDDGAPCRVHLDGVVKRDLGRKTENLAQHLDDVVVGVVVVIQKNNVKQGSIDCAPWSRFRVTIVRGI